MITKQMRNILSKLITKTENNYYNNTINEKLFYRSWKKMARPNIVRKINTANHIICMYPTDSSEIQFINNLN